MNRNSISTTIIVFFIGISSAFSQKLDIKFGDISKADLEMKVYKPDPGADAVILSDCGHAELKISGDNLQIELERDVRIKIINKGGFGYADIEIPYGTSEKVIKVEASTFNLENGTIKETKVSKKSLIIEKTNKYQKKLRIAFPSVYEGSIIEYKYKFITDALYEFIPWEFQSDIPVKYSEFTATYPDLFNYRGIVKGDLSKIAKKTETENVNFGRTYTTQSSHKWIAVNVPAFIEEPYITGQSDHILKLEFELAGVNLPGRGYDEFTPTYEKISEKLLDRNDFGVQLKNTYYLEKTTRNIVKDIQKNLDRLKAIHHFVSNEITWNGIEDYSTSKPLKKVFKDKRGNSAEVNLILVAMLRQAGINTDPVILSTRTNGSLHPFFAMYQKFNYVVALANIDGKEILVDACNPLLPYNSLPFECLNYQGRLIHPTKSKWVNLTNNETKSKVLLFNIIISGNGSFNGSVSQSLNSYDAFDVRQFIKLESKEGYEDYLKNEFSYLNVDSISIANIDSLYNPLKINFNFTSKFELQNTPSGFIFNPTILLGKDNEQIFTSEERKYSIDFGCPTSKITTINLSIPENYYIDELPEKIMLKLPDNKGSYLFSCDYRGNMLTIQSKLTIPEVRFKPEDYRLLREFFAQIIRKQSELIILKKKL